MKNNIEEKIRETIYDFLAEDERFYGKQDGTESITEIPERLIRDRKVMHVSYKRFINSLQDYVKVKGKEK